MPPSDTASQRGWGLLCPNTRPERAQKIARYAQEYLEPALARFPELSGRVYLSLRKYGWLAEYQPVPYIVIRESALEEYPPCRIRSTTAHELMHLVQFGSGIGLDRSDSGQVERQATFLTFSRGFAYDFLRSFPACCPHTPCDHQFKYCYFGCVHLFRGCCKDLSEENLRRMAQKLADLASSYALNDRPDYFRLVRESLLSP